MSLQLISLNSDLARLRNEGYEVDVRGGYVLVHNVPYVDAQRAVRRGVLVSILDLAGDKTVRPSTHVAMFIGDFPCDEHGHPIEQIRHQAVSEKIPGGLVANLSFSAKPKSGAYADYFEKLSTYAAIISSPAEVVDGHASARTFAVVEPAPDSSVFEYIDTFTARAGISSANQQLVEQKVAIIGLGGTGSYILDFVAKTPVKEIHLFDSDEFLTHNAFRAPGAPSKESLRSRPKKVLYLQEIYSRMRRNIFAHEVNLLPETCEEALGDMNFVFLASGSFPGKRAVLQKLEELEIPYVDVGIGMHIVDDSLIGVARVTTSSTKMRAHVWERDRIPLNEGLAEADIYSTNIQIAELNALNAAMAVIRWKKMFGFYQDLENEHHTTYSTNANLLTSEEIPE